MVVASGPMHMAVVDLFRRCRAYIEHLANKVEVVAGERVIEIHGNETLFYCSNSTEKNVSIRIIHFDLPSHFYAGVIKLAVNNKCFPAYIHYVIQLARAVAACGGNTEIECVAGFFSFEIFFKIGEQVPAAEKKYKWVLC